MTKADDELLSRAAAWDERRSLGELSAASLAEITSLHDIEFATAVLYDRIRRASPHRRFIQQLEDRLADHRSMSLRDRSALIGVVPGAFWQQYPHTNADGRFIIQLAEEAGLAVERVPVLNFGSLRENACILLDWLQRTRDRRVVIVSLSKGAQDIKAALNICGGDGTIQQRFAHVASWLSISGTAQGTPLVRWLHDRPLRCLGVRVLMRCRGERFDVINELRREPGAPLWDWPELPSHLSVFHLLSFPLRRHLTHRWAPRGYERIAPLGPNDGGGILLGDAAGWPGVIYPIWGADHYLQPSWDVAPLLRRVLHAAVAVDTVGDDCGERHAQASASTASNAPAIKSMR